MSQRYAVFNGYLLEKPLVFLIKRISHIAEAFTEFGYVLSNKRIFKTQSNKIIYQHQVSGPKLPVNAAGGIGNN